MENEQPRKIGDPCERCSGRYGVYSRRKFGLPGDMRRIGYLRCNCCDHKPSNNCIVYVTTRVPKVDAALVPLTAKAID